MLGGVLTWVLATRALVSWGGGSRDFFVMSATAVVGTMVLHAARGARRGASFAILPAALGLACVPRAAVLAGGVVDSTTLYIASPVLTGLALAVLLAPATRGLGAASPWALALAGAGVATALWTPLPVLVLGVLVLTWVAHRSWHPARRAATPRASFPAFAAGVAACIGFMGLLTARGSADPTPLGAAALGAGLLLGAASFTRSQARRSLAYAAGGSVALAVGFGVIVGGGVDAPLRGAGALAIAAGGLAAGVGVLRAPRAALVGAIAGGLLVPQVGGILSAERVALVAQVRNAMGVRPDELARVRAERAVLHAELGERPAVVRVDGTGRMLLERDGAVLDPAARSTRAEGFAGTLAACATNATQEDRVARVAGDAFGAATLALQAQGVSRIDVAVGTGDLARAVAQVLRPVGRAWLQPGTRLLRVPDAFLVRAGRTADIVVDVVHAPWRADVDDAVLAATRATLAPGGVYVRLLPAARLDAELVGWASRRFAAAFPGASLWVAPEGVDAVLLVGRASATDRFTWTDVSACATRARRGLSSVGVTTPEDLGALAIADEAGMRGLPARRPGPGMPASAWRDRPGAFPLAPAPDPARVFGDDAPRAALRARAETRRAWLELLAAAPTAAPADTFARAASLRGRPGGDAALAALVRPHLAQARAALARGEREGLASTAWSEAETALATARMVAPGLADVRCMEGMLAGARGQVDRAEEALAACVAADPARMDGWEGLARARRTRGDAEGTEAALRGALAAAPGAWRAQHNLGVFLLETDRADEAESLLVQAAALAGRETPPPTTPLVALARLYVGGGRPALALAAAERAVGLEPRDATARGLRGAARYELGQLALAEEDFRAALDLDARQVLSRGGLGQVHAARGEYDLAAAAFRTVLESDPRNAAARENLRRLGPLLQERRVEGGGR